MKKTVLKSEPISEPMRPAETPEGRENQLIELAVNLAEKQLREGTASAQVITHYLKLATAKEKTELEMLEKQKELLEAKTENLKAQKRSEEAYERAMEAFKRYKGIESYE